MVCFGCCRPDVALPPLDRWTANTSICRPACLLLGFIAEDAWMLLSPVTTLLTWCSCDTGARPLLLESMPTLQLVPLQCRHLSLKGALRQQPDHKCRLASTCRQGGSGTQPWPLDEFDVTAGDRIPGEDMHLANSRAVMFSIMLA
jgi:hypothetical protein